MNTNVAIYCVWTLFGSSVIWAIVLFIILAAKDKHSRYFREMWIDYHERWIKTSLERDKYKSNLEFLRHQLPKQVEWAQNNGLGWICKDDLERFAKKCLGIDI